MDPMEQYKAAKAEMKAAIEEANTVVKEVFQKAAKSLFADNAELVSFSWTQYTPYFNDGEECVFGAHIDYPEVNGEDPWFAQTDENQEKMKGLQKKVTAFLQVFDRDDFKSMFGDHCKISVTPAEIEVEDYEHD